MNAGMPVPMVMAPLSVPLAAPMARLAITTRATGHWALSISPAPTATRQKIEPIERSSPPAISTMVGPAASVPRITAWVRMVLKVSKVRKVPDTAVNSA